MTKNKGKIMANYSYLRVSTDKQDVENQKNPVLEYCNKEGLAKVEYISESISSTSKNREIFGLIKSLKKGDNLIIFELSRLARNMRELQKILVDVSEAGATIHAISQNLVIKPDCDDITTKTMIFAFSLSAQIERQMISDRTKAALYARKAKGLPMGRPAGSSKLDSQKDEIEKYLKLGINVSATAKLLGCDRGTLITWLKRNKSKLNLEESKA